MSEEDRRAKLQLCSKYLEMFTQIKDCGKSSVELSIELLVGIKDMISTDRLVYCPAMIYMLLLVGEKIKI